MQKATVSANSASYVRSFNLPDGKEMRVYELVLENPLEGFDKAETYSKKLVDALQQGPAAVTYEIKSNDYGRTLVLKVDKDAPSPSQAPQSPSGASGGSGREFHAAPETVALKLTELWYSGCLAVGDTPSKDDILEAYVIFMTRTSS